MSYVVADVSNDPNAASHVKVSEAFRKSVIDLGCEPAGYLGSWNGYLAFVAEVFGHPTQPVVVATYNFSSWGEGIAFWTMLDDGTIVTTERFGKEQRLWALMTRIFPLHRARTRFLTNVAAGTPDQLLEKHLKNVRAVTRRGARPVTAPPFALYAAVRLRSGDMQGPVFRNFARRAAGITRGLMFGLFVPFTAWVLFKYGLPAAIAVVFPAFVVALTISQIVAPRLAVILVRGSGDTSPVSPDVLLERASKIRECTFDAIKANA
jgi:hypothetical protein